MGAIDGKSAVNSHTVPLKSTIFVTFLWNNHVHGCVQRFLSELRKYSSVCLGFAERWDLVRTLHVQFVFSAASLVSPVEPDSFSYLSQEIEPLQPGSFAPPVNILRTKMAILIEMVSFLSQQFVRAGGIGNQSLNIIFKFIYFIQKQRKIKKKVSRLF